MINKIFNNSPSIFKFLHFIKYPVFFFIVIFTLILIIPNFFNYEKKTNLLKNHLLKEYNLDVKNFKTISYSFFPKPVIIIKNTESNLNGNFDINSKVIKLSLNFVSYYNFNKIKIKKIEFDDSIGLFEIRDLKKILNLLNKIEIKIKINNIDLKILDNKSQILYINKGSIWNNVSKKISFKGFISNNELNIEFLKDISSKKLLIRLPKTGIRTEIIFNENSSLESSSGVIKTKILNSNFKMNFNLDKDLRFLEGKFRNNLLSTKFFGNLKFSPFLYYDLNLKISHLNNKILKKDIFKAYPKFKDIFKKLNGKISIELDDTYLNKKIFKKVMLNMNIINGEINSNNNEINFFGANTKFSINSSKYKNISKIDFDILFSFNDYEKFFKSINLKKINSEFPKKLSLNGVLYPNSRKINFNEILFDESTNIEKDKILYLKEKLENEFFKDGSNYLFDIEQYKNLLLEIY